MTTTPVHLRRSPPRTPASGRSTSLYFLGAYAWTWLFWWSAAATGLAWGSPAVFVLYAAGGAGPLLSAAALLRFREGPDARRRFWRSFIDWRRVPRWWWALLVALAVTPYVAGRLVDGAGGSWLDMGAGTVLIAGIVAGLLEEPGWRGYAQDRLQQRHRGLTAALVVGVFWSVWHLPLFFIDGSFQKDLGVGTGKFWLFFLALVLWAVVYAAAYVGTGSSILALVVLHAVANAAAEVISIDGAEGTETLTLALVALAAAGALLRRERRRATR